MMAQFGKRNAFTLIELLVSVAIFSGVVVLALGAFARSADSSIKSSTVRERTEAARTVIDRIGNDIQYLYTDEVFTANAATECGRSAPSDAIGFNINDSQDCLFMLLKYPGADISFPLVLKKYFSDSQSPRTTTTMYLTESRDCRIVFGSIECKDDVRNLFPSDIIDDKFSLVAGTEGVVIFEGIEPISAEADNTTALLRMIITVKPVNSGSCSITPPSPCYTIKSSFVPGA